MPDKSHSKNQAPAENENEQRQMDEAQDKQAEHIEQTGSITPMSGKHAIHCLTIIGQIEGHYDAAPPSMNTLFHSLSQLNKTRASRVCSLS